MTLKKICLSLAISLSLFAADELDNVKPKQALTVVSDVKQQDAWWNGFVNSKKEITAYVRDLAFKDHLAATWFLMGGKYGYSSVPPTEEQSFNLHEAVRNVAQIVAAGLCFGKISPVYKFVPTSNQSAFYLGWIFSTTEIMLNSFEIVRETDSKPLYEFFDILRKAKLFPFGQYA